MKLRGFTIVELLIVIGVMAILIPITMFGINGLSVKAGDRERESDATSIARQLELVYTNKMIGSSPSYPGSNALSTTATPPRQTVFGGTSNEVTKAPGGTGFDIAIATGLTTTRETNISPRPTESSYTYQPIKVGTTAVCTSQCSSFNLYYLRKSDNTVIMIKSQRQQ